MIGLRPSFHGLLYQASNPRTCLYPDLMGIEYTVKGEPLASSFSLAPQNTTISTIVGMLRDGDIDGSVDFLKSVEDRTGLEVYLLCGVVQYSNLL